MIELVQKWLNNCRIRAHEGKHPPEYEDCFNLCKKVVASEGISEATLCQGSAYSGIKKTPESAQGKVLLYSNSKELNQYYT